MLKRRKKNVWEKGGKDEWLGKRREVEWLGKRRKVEWLDKSRKEE